MTDLTPPDFNQCQCVMMPGHGPFVLGPRDKEQRCTSKPVWLVVETTPGADGKLGSMTLCNECRNEMMKANDLMARVQFHPIPNPT